MESKGFRGAFENGIIDVLPALKFLDLYDKQVKSGKTQRTVKYQEQHKEISNLADDTTPQ
ncbi:MAG: hypothetical protein U9N86_18045 [Bacteroidota bacterium]|nr:hypothetical protein [Bacteroidota bacterium]